MQAKKSTVNVKIDANVKEAAAALLARMGIDQTTAIDMFYRKIIAVRTLPFQPEPLPTNREQLLAAIKRQGIPNITLDADENGHALIDEGKLIEFTMDELESLEDMETDDALDFIKQRRKESGL